MISSSTRFAILGAGSWGTAVAIHLAQAGYPVTLWGRNEKQVRAMEKARENEQYLPGCAFPPSLTVSSVLKEALENSDEVCLAIPSHVFTDVAELLEPLPKRLFWLTKGIEPHTHVLFSEWVAKKWGQAFPCAILSGPSFAKEVAKGLPSALVLASNQKAYQTSLASALHQGAMRIYLSDDMPGVQLGGAVKNVLAIACGMSDGLGFGANTKAALITRGLAEMKRLGMAMGAAEKTFIGLAGMGDLVLTCTDNQSRNRRFGIALGEGKACDEAAKAIGQVVEGFYNASQVLSLARRYEVEMPICEAVYEVLHGKCTVKAAAERLIQRAPASEE